MLSHILRNIICDEFERNVGRKQWEKHIAGKPMHCMEMTFRLSEVDHSNPRFPQAQLLIFAASNYVGVYYRESETRDNYAPWQHLSYHDSCWRGDGVDRFISRFEDRMAILGWHEGLGTNTWYLKREVSKEEAEHLREVTREFRRPKKYAKND